VKLNTDAAFDIATCTGSAGVVIRIMTAGCWQVQRDGLVLCRTC
jgi:hypothetical protein